MNVVFHEFFSGALALEWCSELPESRELVSRDGHFVRVSLDGVPQRRPAHSSDWIDQAYSFSNYFAPFRSLNSPKMLPPLSEELAEAIADACASDEAVARTTRVLKLLIRDVLAEAKR